MTVPSPSPTHTRVPRGFALPSVLIVVVAMLILVVGLMLMTGIERSSARAFVDYERAGLAVDAAMDDFRDTLLREAMTDDFVVIAGKRETPLRPGRLDAPYLFLSRQDDTGIRHQPLFSHRALPEAGNPLLAPAVEPLTDGSAGQAFDFATLPYLDPARVSWIYLTDERGRNVARYAYWTEDMQGRLDASKAGNLDAADGGHLRTAYPFPAPGLPAGDDAETSPTLAAAALYAIDPALTPGNQGELAKTLIDNRSLMISPGSVLASAGAAAPLVRDPTNGRLEDLKLRAVEEALAAENESYLERPLIPFTSGIDPAAVGTPKLNLNEMLTLAPATAVDRIATHIRRALPDFDARKGGFPEDYAKTLAANAIDYASSSDVPTVAPGEYRGVGKQPLVSEFLMRFRWNNIETVDGRKYVEFTATTYVELWNITDQPLSGEAQVTYECKYEFPLGPIPDVSFADLEDATHNLTESDGYFWFPPINVDLQPNEYRVYNCGTVTYRYDVGTPAVFIPSPLELEGETFGSSGAGYRVRWNGVLVDQSGGGIHRNNASLNYPSDTAGSPRQRVRTTIPGHSHTRSGAFVNNMGDPRMAWYLAQPQDANAYPGNYSPNRRNIRRGSIYDSDGATKPKVYGRVLPSEWPDGGHNSFYSSGTPFTTTDQRVNPDDERFFNNLPQRLPGDAPQRVSRRGRFFSATELGNVYDPIMWFPTYPVAADTNQLRNGFLPSGKDRWPDVLPSSPATADFGGGNTLRIGRPEHPAFDLPGDRTRHAVRLLDLFHTGIPLSEAETEREGPLVRIDGHVNLNTASRDALRALAEGPITHDPRLARRLTFNHLTTNLFAPRIAALQLGAPRDSALADRVADAIIAARPFASPADAVFARTSNGEYVFGNRAQYPEAESIQWADSAAEELFARVYQNATVRSRNYRVWIVGQALAPGAASVTNPKVLAESRKVFTVFADPGERDSTGEIIPENTRIRIRHESDF